MIFAQDVVPGLQVIDQAYLRQKNAKAASLVAAVLSGLGPQLKKLLQVLKEARVRCLRRLLLPSTRAF